ncbi:hypothetical protein F5882DRAFT_377227 [Hyaloscypha sp. PMI_1271]|nr:hypothetical protein F5882DRAFT_377227 [Hyaloscypha sp. PMI_1271]
MDVDENNGGQGLFVQPGRQSSSSTKPNGTPQVNLTEPNGKSKPVIIGGHSNDDEEEEGFTPAQAREASGQSHGGKIVAWRQQDRSKLVIVMYGPQNAAKYERSTAAREDNDFDEDEIAQFGPDNRLGDVKVNKKFVRRKRELMSILGLAYNYDLDDLQPREKGEKRRLPPLEIWVKWKINGEIKKHAKRHQEWLDGQREAKDKSPTPDPNSRLSLTPEPTGTKPIKTESDDNSQPQPGPPPPESPILKYKKQ